MLAIWYFFINIHPKKLLPKQGEVFPLMLLGKSELFKKSANLFMEIIIYLSNVRKNL